MKKLKFYLLVTLGAILFWTVFFAAVDYAIEKQTELDEVAQARYECRIAQNGDNCNF